ncbi:MAG TPA: NAD(P)/FAD-dependent oxidoreductase [Desulfobacterales bacterium]|nr:NAD(P)/FAD-dependent oxidoreductase [Desulfobacterales bacterium]
MRIKEYDLIVLGTGDAGLTVALAAAKERWKVAIIEKKAIGGTCALWGCVPKKVLISGEELANFSQRMAAAGLSSKTTPDWSEIMAFKLRLTGSFSQGSRSNLQKNGIDIYEGAASFVGEAAIRVGEVSLQSTYIHIATGACPRPLGIPGEEFMTTSAEFLYLEELPQRLVFVGGGYISFEFAHLAARYGRDVTIIHRGAEVLKKFDPDLVALLVKASEELGITVAINQSPLRIEKKKGELLVNVQADGEEKQYHADMVVHGAGRVPDIANLNLEAAGIEASQDGVVVNEYLQSISNPRIYAAGDAAAGGLPLTPVAMVEGKVAADNLIYGLKHLRADYRVVPSVVFTLPKLASVGLQELEANRQGLQYDVKFRETADWLHNLRINEPFAGFKIILDRTTGRILGAHLLDSHADDLINLFALAMQHNLTAADIKQVLYAYPTASSSVQYMVG